MGECNCDNLKPYINSCRGSRLTMSDCGSLSGHYPFVAERILHESSSVRAVRSAKCLQERSAVVVGEIVRHANFRVFRKSHLSRALPRVQ